MIDKYEHYKQFIIIKWKNVSLDKYEIYAYCNGLLDALIMENIITDIQWNELKEINFKNCYD